MNTRTFALATLVAAMAACSTVPERNSALEQARGRFNSAQSDPQVASLAPEELKRAAQALATADKANAERSSLATVDHLAYMTVQRVTIAQDTAKSRASQAVTASAAAERDKMRLALRTNEADMAKQQLAATQQTMVQTTAELDAARQANARKTAELAAAETAAASEKVRVDMRNAQIAELEAQLREINAKKTDRGLVVTLGDVLFDSGQARLLPDRSGNMSKLADFFKRYPQRTASIEGYTDSVGSASSNLDLSGRRAGAVMTALVSMGVGADRLITKAHGEEMPAATNDTAAGRQLNRRVEIVIAPSVGELTLK